MVITVMTFSQTPGFVSLNDTFLHVSARAFISLSLYLYSLFAPAGNGFVGVGGGKKVARGGGRGGGGDSTFCTPPGQG